MWFFINLNNLKFELIFLIVNIQLQKSLNVQFITLKFNILINIQD